MEQKIATRELRWQGLGWPQGALTLWAPPNWLPRCWGLPVIGRGQDLAGAQAPVSLRRSSRRARSGG